MILCLYAEVFTSDLCRECFPGRSVVREMKSCSKQKLSGREKGILCLFSEYY